MRLIILFLSLFLLPFSGYNQFWEGHWIDQDFRLIGLGDDNDDNQPVYAVYFQGDTLNGINTNTTAGNVTLITLDTACETAQISIPDPNNNPLPPFNAYFIDPKDEAGNDITDLSGNVNVTMRVRSAEFVNLDILFRSGGGSMEERTARKVVAIPGDLLSWTNITVSFSEAELEGFDPTDLRDMWFYLDRGSPNFRGNEFYIDHIVIGGMPDSTQFSPCILSVTAENWVENWDSDITTVLGGPETAKLTLEQTECEELKISVTDPLNDPYLRFRPIVIRPLNQRGSPIRNIEGNTQIIIRARSAEEMSIGVLFRSGIGGPEYRTKILTQTVAGTLEAWSTLNFNFESEDIAGFDPTDLLDIWIFLDRENDNFPGNELYIDYITTEPPLDTMVQSPCGLPGIVVGTQNISDVPLLEVSPNPTSGILHIEFEKTVLGQERKNLILFDVQGRLLWQWVVPGSQNYLRLDISDIPPGINLLQVRSGDQFYTTWILKQ